MIRSISPRLKRLFAAALDVLLVLAVAALAYRQYGFLGLLDRDDAIYLYSGQQLAQGVPPFVSVFDHKGPLAPMLAGAGAWLSVQIGIDDIMGVRATFLAISLLAVAGLYLLARDLFDSRALGIVAAMLFINFWGFGRHAISGPRAKAAMLLFEVLALWLTGRKRWFWAGLCGSLAFLTWQPTAIYALIAFALAAIQSQRQERAGGALRVAAGIAVPVILVGIVFAVWGAFAELVQGTILFNLIHLERGEASVLGNLRQIRLAVFNGYPTMFVPLWLGFAVLPALWMQRWEQAGRRLWVWLSTDRFCALLLSVPLPFLWSAIDFQWYPDFYVLLPYTAIGLAWLLGCVSSSVAQGNSALRAMVTVLVCVTLAATAIYTYRETSSQELLLQRAWANEVMERYGPDARVASIGLPEALVLLHRTNPDPYVFIINGIDNRIHATTPGGFEGWLQRLEAADLDVIFYGSTRGRHAPRLEEWLRSRYQETKVGEWTLYVRPNGSE